MATRSRTDDHAQRGEMVRYGIFETSLGPMLLAASEQGVCRLSFAEVPGDLTARFPGAIPAGDDTEFAQLADRVIAVVEHEAPAAGIAVDQPGTAFQQSVWAQLCAIPKGETRSYGDIAAALGNPNASRAVGGANAANGVAVLVPCHRVVASNGSLGGYAYGAAIKSELLRRERDGAQMSRS